MRLIQIEYDENHQGNQNNEANRSGGMHFLRCTLFLTNQKSWDNRSQKQQEYDRPGQPFLIDSEARSIAARDIVQVSRQRKGNRRTRRNRLEIGRASCRERVEIP